MPHLRFRQLGVERATTRLNRLLSVALMRQAMG